MVTTAELHVSFIKPFCSEAFVFSSQIMSMGNTLIRTAGIAREKNSKKIVATATGTFVPLKKWGGEPQPLLNQIRGDFNTS